MNSEHFNQLTNVVSNVSRETFDDLMAYKALVKKWQPHINLIANATVPEIWSRHILDSAQLFDLAPREAVSWLDIGSGGGFPGIVLAILLKGRCKSSGISAHMNMVESNGKKVAFLRTVSAALDLPVTVHQARIEDSYDAILTPDIITARALASLTILFEFIHPWFGMTTFALLQKGRDYAREVSESGAQWQFNLIQHKSIIDEDSVILEVRELRPVM